MKIIYETISESIRRAISDATKAGRIIKRIELSDSEWEDFLEDFLTETSNCANMLSPKKALFCQGKHTVQVVPSYEVRYRDPARVELKQH